MEPPISPLLFSALLLTGMLLLLETGRRVGLRRRQRESEGEQSGLGTVEGAVFALFGLLVAFTFSGAALRFNEKRMLIAEEANAIETAYLRLHLVPQERERELQDLFRRYVDSRLETYRKLPDLAAAQFEITKYKELQKQIWATAVAATKLPDCHPDAGKLLLPALNNMIDITTTRSSARRCCRRLSSARARSVSRWRSWNSSSTTTETPFSCGSLRSRRVSTPSVTYRRRVFGPLTSSNRTW